MTSCPFIHRQSYVADPSTEQFRVILPREMGEGMTVAVDGSKNVNVTGSQNVTSLKKSQSMLFRPSNENLSVTVKADVAVEDALRVTLLTCSSIDDRTSSAVSVNEVGIAL